MQPNFAAVHETLADAFPDRPGLIWRRRTWTYGEIRDRTRQLARVLAEAGLGRRSPADRRSPWESHQDLVGLYLTNGNAYLEGMLGASKAGAAAFNGNYRYVADELAHLFNDAGAGAIIYQGCFAATLGEVLPQLRRAPRLLRVDDGSGDELLPGAVDYEEALEAASTAPLDVEMRSDDLYVVYTGGTTGHPKGVLWRQVDFLTGALGFGLDPEDGIPIDAAGVIEAARNRRLRALPAPPLMHGAAHWNALSCWLNGGTILMQDETLRLDPDDVLDTCERDGATSLLIVGDAFARPLIDAQRRKPRDLGALRHIVTGGAILSPALRQDLLALVPRAKIIDILGSSESGRQAVAQSSVPDGSGPDAGSGFQASPTTAVLSEDRSKVLDPDRDRDVIGWLARTGPMPTGYLGDREKTLATFPTVEGRRWAVAGDRARWRGPGQLDLLGRDSVTINTGGEKVFAEEVEQVLKGHPAVYDLVVVGRPSERWGQEVVAVASIRPDHTVTLDELRRFGSRLLASYKLPKDLVICPTVERSPSGKPDYAWALGKV